MNAPCKVCPECGSEEHSLVWQRHNFSFPISPMDPPERMTIRYPLAKCSACQAEYRNVETYSVVSKAIAEHVERKMNEKLVEDNAVKEAARRNWIMTGLIIGTLFAHAINLLMQKMWLLGGLTAAMSFGMWALIFNADRAFNWFAGRKVKQQAAQQPSVVDDALMEKLFGGDDD